MERFRPHPLLRQCDLMTIAGAFWPRRYLRLPRSTERLFEVGPGAQILAKCNWQTDARNSPAMVLLHGLEGSSESSSMLGVAQRAFGAGFSVLRLNQRNCGGTEALAPTLYNSGMSRDYRAVLDELIERDGLSEVFFAGHSMGGNLILKMAGELGESTPPQLRAICAVCPALDLARCVDACCLPRNFIYDRHFVKSLKGRVLRKEKLFPGRFRLDGLDGIRTLREFDDKITAPNSGYRDAADYYFQCSALRVVDRIHVPTLILASKDDPVVPAETFSDPAITANRRIRVILCEHGGHGAFVSSDSADRFWAEARVVEFCRELVASSIAPNFNKVLRANSIVPPKTF
jgi:uncharacterized protein